MDDVHFRSKGIIKLAAAAGALAALLPAAALCACAAETESDLPTRLMNGSFEYPTLTASDADMNKDVGTPWFIGTYESLNSLAEERNGTGFYWQTTAYNPKTIELVRNAGDLAGSYTISQFPDGNQCAELVAEEQASLYQNMKTYPGQVVNWNLAHKARQSRNNDTMAVFIGPKQSDLTKVASDGNDIFMWMGKLLKSVGVITDADTSFCTDKIIVYSQSNINLSEVTEDNYTEYFSLTKTEAINTEWSCWAITDVYTTWGIHTGVYEVPEGQTETVFAYTALDGIINSPRIENQYNEGNLVDGIRFEVNYPLRVSTTAGGVGRVLNEDGSLAADGEVTQQNDHFGLYGDGTELKITAEEENGYSFIGANIDDVFRSAEELKQSDGTYRCSLTMDTGHYARLIFAKDHTVIFDPNGGIYNGTTEDTEIKMGSGELTAYTSGAIEPPDGRRFLGWYVARFPNAENSNDLGAYIHRDVKIDFIAGNETNADRLKTEFNYISDAADTAAKNYELNAEGGLTFVAQWEYRQLATAKTKGKTDASYSQSSTGGTVEITALGADSDTREIETDQNKSSSSGYGRYDDRITMTAAVTDNDYIFMGWYDSDSGEWISNGNIYTYQVSRPRNIEARFCAVLAYPYLSFVSESEHPQTSDSTFSGGSHLKIGETVVPNYGGTGEEAYGNTISTGFSTAQTFSGLTHDRCLWTINIPAATSETPLYIKLADDMTPSDMTIDSSPILTDTGSNVKNKGSIRKVTGSVAKTITLLDKLPTITGDGTVVFGVVIDNLYAPGATATIELFGNSAAKPDNNADMTGTDNRSSHLHASTSEEYSKSENNWYN